VVAKAIEETTDAVEIFCAFAAAETGAGSASSACQSNMARQA